MFFFLLRFKLPVRNKARNFRCLIGGCRETIVDSVLKFESHVERKHFKDSHLDHVSFIRRRVFRQKAEEK